MQWFANFFVSQARMNVRKFTSPTAEAAALIYNYKPVGSDSYEPYLFAAARGEQAAAA